jgi:hypothetical protein
VTQQQSYCEKSRPHYEIESGYVAASPGPPLTSQRVRGLVPAGTSKASKEPEVLHAALPRDPGLHRMKGYGDANDLPHPGKMGLLQTGRSIAVRKLVAQECLRQGNRECPVIQYPVRARKSKPSPIAEEN